MMKHFVLAAVVAFGLILVSGKSAQAHGVYGFVPGHISLSGSAHLSWGAIGFGQLSPIGYGYGPAYGYGYAPAYGHAPVGPIYYAEPPIYYNYTPAYGYGYPDCCGK
ncbi:MAG: hypothetical protein SNJ75_19535 [Gemmataceae bacterium]